MLASELRELILDRAALGVLIFFGSYVGGYMAVRMRRPTDPNE